MFYSGLKGYIGNMSLLWRTCTGSSGRCTGFSQCQAAADLLVEKINKLINKSVSGIFPITASEDLQKNERLIQHEAKFENEFFWIFPTPYLESYFGERRSFTSGNGESLLREYTNPTHLLRGNQRQNNKSDKNACIFICN